jgi:hypothetical protein
VTDRLLENAMEDTRDIDMIEMFELSEGSKDDLVDVLAKARAVATEQFGPAFADELYQQLMVRLLYT